ncbi:MAG: cell division protein FtsH [Planctomycetes bacterium]|nr:cell division protein FtsH [Planctomycetota bacterium]
MNEKPTQVATAYHEAGHAVAALFLGRAVQRVSIEPVQMRLGRCELQKGRFKPTQDLLETEVLILLAGPAAEARHTGRYDWNSAAQDLRDVRRLTQQRAASLRQVEKLERRLLDKTEYILERPGVWEAVERIASELLEHTTISGRAARHLFDELTSQ